MEDSLAVRVFDLVQCQRRRIRQGRPGMVFRLGRQSGALNLFEQLCCLPHSLEHQPA